MFGSQPRALHTGNDESQRVTELTLEQSNDGGKTWIEVDTIVTETVETDDVQAVKAEHGVPAALQSCHTAVVDGYVVEGHVPAADVARLLSEAPEATGLAVPGMPVGSPGMEQGDAVQPYDVLLVADGQTSVFAGHGR